MSDFHSFLKTMLESGGDGGPSEVSLHKVSGSQLCKVRNHVNIKPSRPFFNVRGGTGRCGMLRYDDLEAVNQDQEELVFFTRGGRAYIYRVEGSMSGGHNLYLRRVCKTTDYVPTRAASARAVKRTRKEKAENKDKDKGEEDDKQHPDTKDKEEPATKRQRV